MKTKNIIVYSLFTLSLAYLIIFNLFFVNYSAETFILTYDLIYKYIALPTLIISFTYMLSDLLKNKKYQKTIFTISLALMAVFLISILPVILAIFGFNFDLSAIVSLNYFIYKYSLHIFIFILFGISLNSQIKK